MMTDPDVADLIRALPGRGGVRLPYAQAQLALRLIETGARALERDIRARRRADADRRDVSASRANPTERTSDA